MAARNVLPPAADIPVLDKAQGGQQLDNAQGGQPLDAQVGQQLDAQIHQQQNAIPPRAQDNALAQVNLSSDLLFCSAVHGCVAMF
jgi:hypothetical protein